METPQSKPASPPQPASAAPVSRVLVADQSLTNRRLIREILTAFMNCEVDDAATAEHAYERAIQQPYKLFIFAFSLPDFSGALLDRLLGRVYPKLHSTEIIPPPVIFLVQSSEATAFHQIHRDARIRGSVPLPLNLDTLMTMAGGVLTRK